MAVYKHRKCQQRQTEVRWMLRSHHVNRSVSRVELQSVLVVGLLVEGRLTMVDTDWTRKKAKNGHASWIGIGEFMILQIYLNDWKLFVRGPGRLRGRANKLIIWAHSVGRFHDGSLFVSVPASSICSLRCALIWQRPLCVWLSIHDLGLMLMCVFNLCFWRMNWRKFALHTTNLSLGARR